ARPASRRCAAAPGRGSLGRARRRFRSQPLLLLTLCGKAAYCKLARFAQQSQRGIRVPRGARRWGGLPVPGGGPPPTLGSGRGNRAADPDRAGAEGSMTRLNVIDARCEALFASGLQRSDEPTAQEVTAAISRAVRELGTRGCA